MKRNNFHKKILLILLITFSTFLIITHPIFAQETPLQNTFVDQSELINILKTTNESLSQQWTPLNISLMVMTLLLGILTLLWGIFFAFGFALYRKAKSVNKQIAENYKQIELEKEKTFRFLSDSVSEIEKEIKSKKKGATKIEKDLEDFRTKAEGILNNLQNKTVETLSENVFSLNNMTGTARIMNSNISVCSKCGALFQNTPFSGGFGGSVIGQTNYVATTPGRKYISQGFGFGAGFGNLCPRCKEEENNSPLG